MVKTHKSKRHWLSHMVTLLGCHGPLKISCQVCDMDWQYLSHSDNHYVFLMFDKNLGRIISRSKVISSGVDISTTLAEVQHRLSSTSKTGRRLLRVSSCWPPPLNASSTTVLHSLLSLTLAVEERQWGESQSKIYQFDRFCLYEVCEPRRPEKREKINADIHVLAAISH